VEESREVAMKPTVPIADQWESLRLQCLDDARGYIAECMASVRENYVPASYVLAGFDGLAVLYASLMAKHARLEVEHERLAAEHARRLAEVNALLRRGWLRRVLGF